MIIAQVMGPKDWALILTPMATILAVLLHDAYQFVKDKRQIHHQKQLEAYETFYVPAIKWFYQLNPDGASYQEMKWNNPDVDKMDQLITENIKYVSPEILKIHILYFRSAHEQGSVKTDSGLDISMDFLNSTPKEAVQHQSLEIAKYFHALMVTITTEANKESRKLGMPEIGKPMLENLQDMNLAPKNKREGLWRLLHKRFDK